MFSVLNYNQRHAVGDCSDVNDERAVQEWLLKKLAPFHPLVFENVEAMAKHIDENDGHYHLRVQSSMSCIFYLDIEVDGLPIQTVKDRLIEFFNTCNIDVLDSDIKYTINEGKFASGLGSYHVSIISLRTTVESNKHWAIEFSQEFNLEVDDSVYNGNSGSFFRLPYQTKGINKNSKEKPNQSTVHLVMEGCTRDFIVNVPYEGAIELPVKGKKAKDKKEKQTRIKSRIVDPSLALLTLAEREVALALDLFECLSLTRIESYSKWIEIGLWCYSVGLTCDHWKTVSLKTRVTKQQQQVKDEDICVEYWRSFKAKKYSFNTLVFWAKEDSVKKANKILGKHEFNSWGVKEYSHENIDTVKVNRTFLTDLENDVLKMNKEMEELTNTVMDTDEYYALAIKSPYGTSKTQIMKLLFLKEIEKNPSARILWVSFRKTFTNEVIGNFGQLGFVSYQATDIDNPLKSSRLICQLESLLKVQHVNEADNRSSYRDTYEVNKTYDIIVLDELESVLNQFYSETMKGKSVAIFRYLKELINTPRTKVIALDGDLSDRGLHFLANVTHQKRVLFIDNEYRGKGGKHEFTSNQPNFIDSIVKKLKGGENVCLCSMSATIAKEIVDRCVKEIPGLIFGLYTGDMDSVKKFEDLQHVNETWKVQLLVFSPTVMAGVSFDVYHHFHCIFGIISSPSCSPRDFLQMLERVRNPISRKIKILYPAKMSVLEYAHFYTPEEVRSMYLKSNHLEEDHEMKLYDQIQLYNNVEDLNKNSFYFLNELIRRASKKNISYEFIDEVERKKIKQPTTLDRVVLKAQTLFLAGDINDYVANNLIKKQNNNTISELENGQLERFFMRKALRIDTLTKDVINDWVFNVETISNMGCLISKSNFPAHVSEHSTDYLGRIEYHRYILVQKILKSMGIPNPLQPKKISFEELGNVDSETFSSHNIALFTLEKKKGDSFEKKEGVFVNLKSVLGTLNTFLKLYGLVLKSDRKGKKKSTGVLFEQILNIAEIAHYKKIDDKWKDESDMITQPIECKYESLRPVLIRETIDISAFAFQKRPTEQEIYDDPKSMFYKDEAFLRGSIFNHFKPLDAEEVEPH